MEETIKIVKAFNAHRITADEMNEKLDAELESRNIELTINDDGSVSMDRG